MDAKEAVSVAKLYLQDLFSEEGLVNLGLEEIERGGEQGTWDVTLGFSRPWNTTRNALTALTGEVAARRTLRVVRVRDSDGTVLSIKRREAVD